MKTLHIPPYAKIAALFVVALLPTVAFGVQTLRDLIFLATTYLGYAIPFIVSLSIVVFVWGIYRYFFKVDTDKKEAMQLVMWGVLGFFVMVSFWGLVNVLIRTFGFDTIMPGIPTIHTNSGYGGSTGANTNLNFGGSTGANTNLNYGGSTGGNANLNYGGSTGANNNLNFGGSTGGNNSSGYGGSTGANENNNFSGSTGNFSNTDEIPPAASGPTGNTELNRF